MPGLNATFYGIFSTRQQHQPTLPEVVFHLWTHLLQDYHFCGLDNNNTKSSGDFQDKYKQLTELTLAWIISKPQYNRYFVWLYFFFFFYFFCPPLSEIKHPLFQKWKLKCTAYSQLPNSEWCSHQHPSCNYRESQMEGNMDATCQQNSFNLVKLQSNGYIYRNSAILSQYFWSPQGQLVNSLELTA